MSGACGRYGGRRRVKGFWWLNLKERGHIEGIGLDKRIILRWAVMKWDVEA